MSVFIVVILLSSPVVWAAPSPDAGRTLEAGHQYQLELQGIQTQVGGQDYIPDKKPMTVTLGRTDLGNLMMEFSWTHDPGPDVPRTNYAIILGFDFDNDGVWTANTPVYKPDDALALVALGFDIDICLGNNCDWIRLFIPYGLYVASFGIDPNKASSTTNEWVFIGGPPADPTRIGPKSGVPWEGVKCGGGVCPGPEYPDGSPVLFNPYYTDTSYVMKIGVPLELFTHGLSGFGFFLTQQTTVLGPNVNEQPWLAWGWPLQGQSAPIQGQSASIPNDWLGALGAADGSGAQYLGNLDPNAQGPYNYALADPPGGPDTSVVGGFATAADRIALVTPWIAITSILGIALLLAVRAARKRKA